MLSLPLSGAEAAPGDPERFDKLEKAVRQLQQRNAELESEVRKLKEKGEAFAPDLPQGRISKSGLMP